MKSKSEKLFKQLEQLRLNAEAKLGELDAPQAPSASPEELLHELRVHQLELEMQNEELQRAQMALAESHAHYVELYHFSPVSYLTINADGIILEINLPGAVMLGVERLALMQQRFERFIAEADKDRWFRFFMLAKQENHKQSTELLLRRQDGSTVYVQMNCVYIQQEYAPSVLRLALSDISERKKSEDALKIAAIAFETQETIFVTDAEHLIQRVNRPFSRMTGYSSKEVIGKTKHFLCAEQDNTALHDAIWLAIRVKGSWEGEVAITRKDGTVFPASLKYAAYINAAGNITHYVCCLTDISAQKQAEKALLKARLCLENQVAHSAAEKENIQQERAEIDNALNLLYASLPRMRKV